MKNNSTYKLKETEYKESLLKIRSSMFGSDLVFTDIKGNMHAATLTPHVLERFFFRYRKIDPDFFTPFSDKTNLVNTLIYIFSQCWRVLHTKKSYYGTLRNYVYWGNDDYYFVVDIHTHLIVTFIFRKKYIHLNRIHEDEYLAEGITHSNKHDPDKAYYKDMI